MTTCTTTLRCGGTLHVLIAATAEELAVLVETHRRLLVKPNGHAVIDSAGCSVFIVDEILHPLKWHKNGNHVWANRILRTVAADGAVTSSVLRKVLVKP